MNFPGDSGKRPRNAPAQMKGNVNNDASVSENIREWRPLFPMEMMGELLTMW